MNNTENTGFNGFIVNQSTLIFLSFGQPLPFFKSLAEIVFDTVIMHGVRTQLKASHNRFHTCTKEFYEFPCGSSGGSCGKIFDTLTYNSGTKVNIVDAEKYFVGLFDKLTCKRNYLKCASDKLIGLYKYLYGAHDFYLGLVRYCKGALKYFTCLSIQSLTRLVNNLGFVVCKVRILRFMNGLIAVQEILSELSSGPNKFSQCTGVLARDFYYI